MLFFILCLSFTGVFCHANNGSETQVYTLGFITGNRNPDGTADVTLPGVRIRYDPCRRGVVPTYGLAVDDVNTKGLLPKDVRLRYKIAETYGRESVSILQTAKLWKENISAFIGPQETCLHEARIAASFNLPMISHFCTHFETSNKLLYPTFARTKPPATSVSKSVASLLLRYQWNEVAFFYSNTSMSAVSDNFAIADAIANVFKNNNIKIKFIKTWSEMFHHGWNSPDLFLKLIQDTMEDVRVYVILGGTDEQLGFLEAMDKCGLFKSDQEKEYQVIGILPGAWDHKDPSKYLRGSLMQKGTRPNMALRRGMKHFLALIMTGDQETAQWSYETFTKRVKQHMMTGPFSDLLSKTSIKLLKLKREAAYLYDAVRLYAISLNKILTQRLGNPLNGSLVIQNIVNQTYTSALGYDIYMDEHGDSEGNFSLLSYGKIKRGFPGLFPIGNFRLAGNRGDKLPELFLHKKISWPRGKPPLAVPICGFRNEKCFQKYAEREIVMGVLGGLSVVLSVVVMIAYRNYKYEQELDSLLWRIDQKDLVLENLTQSKVITSRNKSQSFVNNHSNKHQSQTSLTSHVDSGGEYRFTAIFTKIGVYKGRICAVKRSIRENVDITRKMKKELKAMRDLRHDNLNSFIGACVEPGEIHIVTEYCSRGSLRDILDNEDVKLDPMFIASLIGDIIRGMIFLHDSSLKFHANLKASNCLVDSRWVLKVSDFGLKDFRSPWESVEDFLNEDLALSPIAAENLLYRSPELLRERNAKFIEKANSALCQSLLQKSDVYSFSIILYEIHLPSHLRSNSYKSESLFPRPFGEWNMSTQEILKKIIHPQIKQVGSKKFSPMRPKLESLESCYEFVKSCLKDCWDEDPDLRPDFKTIRTRLRPLRKGMKANIFDNMISMMETYANNLESLVDDRTQLLIDEKKKTEQLLLEMLPRSVSEQLKQGRPVMAESFDNVSIYFSDLVGFTQMSAESTPLQVVDFLNDLYTLFDSTLENFDVYKVETIGDAYMVASGLPDPNGERHAGEIASMALTLLENVKEFKIRHRPEDTLKLRSGIHTGPVCAGVVGRKMPRYCLFGDTVNTASRMESSGLPQKVHCSSKSKEFLDRLGGYILEERGPIELKGKGEQVTFWLLDEDRDARVKRMKERTTYIQTQKSSYSSSYDILRPSSSRRSSELSWKNPLRLKYATKPIPHDLRGMNQSKRNKTSSFCIVEETPATILDASHLECNLDDEDEDEVFYPNSSLDPTPHPHHYNSKTISYDDVGSVPQEWDFQQEIRFEVPHMTKRNSCPCIENTKEYYEPSGQFGINTTESQLKVPEYSPQNNRGSICNASLSSILNIHRNMNEAFEGNSREMSRNLSSLKKSKSFKISKFIRKSKKIQRHSENYANPELAFDEFQNLLN